jgi:EEF1A N-terminal glycine/lysine methyltransferase
VVITDYPDNELIENIRFNVKNCGINEDLQSHIAVEGYLWGADPQPLQSHINGQKFDIMILSDTVLPLPSHTFSYDRYSTTLNTNLSLNPSSST